MSQTENRFWTSPSAKKGEVLSWSVEIRSLQVVELYYEREMSEESFWISYPCQLLWCVGCRGEGKGDILDFHLRWTESVQLFGASNSWEEDPHQEAILRYCRGKEAGRVQKILNSQLRQQSSRWLYQIWRSFGLPPFKRWLTAGLPFVQESLFIERPDRDP